ncbi:xanthine dehydrogenase accessory protein XdhC [Georgenia sp. H159]|uniref:xanthine dehydrogenase accessory protein XdhC n=1 Tax=Georgenia sp. H159 TaxID=3076115 RepID=UPI002D79FFD6|nr:xanthine dehydrogenase accessory protein XdhC [Georgenia sp. H159]
MDWLEAAARVRADGRSAVLVTVSAVRGHSPREAGAKMVVTTDGSFDSIGGGNLEATVTDRARELLAAGARTPETITMSLNDRVTTRHGRQCCGGEVTVLLEPLPARPTVAVFGVGHVGLELARILARHQLIVHLVDSRADQLDDAGELVGQIADVRVHHAPAPEAVLADLPTGAHVYVMTHDHAEDMVLCDAALRRGDLSVGLIGSRAKWARFRKKLIEGGHPPTAVDSITCPIGVATLTGKSPAVIAVSVAADLLARLAADADPRGPTHVAELHDVIG